MTMTITDNNDYGYFYDIENDYIHMEHYSQNEKPLHKLPVSQQSYLPIPLPSRPQSIFSGITHKILSNDFMRKKHDLYVKNTNFIHQSNYILVFALSLLTITVISITTICRENN